MNKIMLVLLMVLVCMPIMAQEQVPTPDHEELKMVRLVGVHYMHRSREYEGSSAAYDDFDQSINNWGLGGTVFAGYGPLGIYSQGQIFIPTGHELSPSSPVGSQDMEGFRLGFDNLSGIGFNLELGPSMGILLGGGLHWSFAFQYKDKFYDKAGDEPALYFDLGLGGAANLYIMASEVINIHVGATSSWDFLTLHGNSYLNQNWDKGTRWVYGFSGGIGFRL